MSSSGKRLVDGEALWKSKKLLLVPEKYRGEYANLIPLAEVNGCFECEPALIWARVYAYNRQNVTPDQVAEALDAFEAAGMLERYDSDGKTYAIFVGIDKDGRLPGPATVARYPNLPPEPMRSNLPIESVVRDTIETKYDPEDKKLYSKELKAAVKKKGYDDLLAALDVWMETDYIGRKPVTAFLKSLDAAPRPPAGVTSSALQRVQDAVAVVSNSQCFFHTAQKVAVAEAVKEYGEDLVIAAFREFWAGVSSDQMQFAAPNFASQVGTRVRAMIQKQAQRREQDLVARETLRQAQADAAKELEAAQEDIEEEL